MVKGEIPNNNVGKYSRVLKREIFSYELTDQFIRDYLTTLEQNNSDVWNNPSYNKNEFIHSIFQYPAMMVPEVQRQIIDAIFRYTGSQQIKAMLDPFMGSATSLISSMHYGIDCYGQDINPLAVLISKVRTSLINVNFKKLKANINFLLSLIRTDHDTKIESSYYNIDKWFKKSTQLELSKIVRAIRTEDDICIRRFYWANLAEVIRICSNDRTSTYKLHARPEQEVMKRKISAIDAFEEQMALSLNSYAEFKDFLRRKGRVNSSGYIGEINIQHGDSLKEISFGNGDKPFADLLISSPPYGDNHTTVTYGQYSFLQLQWIDLQDIYEGCNSDFLRTTSEIDSLSIGGKKRLKDFLIRLDHMFNSSPHFRHDYLVLGHLDFDKKEKILSFLYDLDIVMTNSVKALTKNSYMVWTMGNRSVGGHIINNVKYLKDMLEAKGCVFVHSMSRTIHNKRMAKKNGTTALMNTEEILVFRKL